MYKGKGSINEKMMRGIPERRREERCEEKLKERPN